MREVCFLCFDEKNGRCMACKGKKPKAEVAESKETAGKSICALCKKLEYINIFASLEDSDAGNGICMACFRGIVESGTKQKRASKKTKKTRKL
jgi:hypothetical protein